MQSRKPIPWRRRVFYNGSGSVDTDAPALRQGSENRPRLAPSGLRPASSMPGEGLPAAWVCAAKY